MKVVLHIGVHKTGTTAIQRTLHANCASLLERGYFYQPPGPDQHNHHAIALGLRQGAENRDWAVDALRQQFDQASAAGCHTCIISSEMFIENPDIALIRQLLAGHTLQIIAYMRRPDEMVASAYNQLVRDSNRPWQRALSDAPYPYDPTYLGLLGNWIAEFSPDELTLAPFDWFQWPEQDLVLDFFRMVGIKDTFLLNRSFTDAEVNFSLPAGMIEILRLANATIPMSPNTHAELVHGLYELRKQYPAFYPNDVSLMEDAQRRECFRRLKSYLPKYRPYFRPGFKEDFLHWRRPSIREKIGKALLRR